MDVLTYGTKKYRLERKKLIKETKRLLEKRGFFLNSKYIKYFINFSMRRESTLPTLQELLYLSLKSENLIKKHVRGCSEKVKYKSKKESLAAKARMKKTHQIEFHHYKCKHCKHFHITKENPDLL